MITNQAEDPKAVIILAHGAGAGMNHAFMATAARELSQRGITTIRFNFPYMEAGRKSPGSPKANIKAWKEVIDTVLAQYPDLPVYIGGKSYGGRMGSHVLAENPELAVKGIVYFGFPLHAPGKVSVERAKHLPEINVPQLFLQGVNDKLATIELMRELTSDLPMATLIEFDRADHSFKVPKSSGIPQESIIPKMAEEIVAFMQKQK